MSRVRILILCVTLLFVICIQGCREVISPGHYEGNLLKHGPEFKVQPVQFEITPVNESDIRIEIQDRDKKGIASAVLSKRKKHEITVATFGIEDGMRTLFRVPVKSRLEPFKCYESKDAPRLQFCFSQSQFYFRFLNSESTPFYTVVGNKFNKEEKFELEEPQEISLSGAIDLALTQSYDSKISIEHVFQAKNSAMAAWLNLLPHLTSNLIWHAPFPTYVTAVAVLQGLTPFLLPTWWMDARIADLNARIQEDVVRIVQADLASNVEQLIYAFERDAQIVSAHQSIATLLGKIPSEELSGLIPFKQSLEGVVKATLSEVESVLELDRYALSLALGKHNPESISNVSIDWEPMPLNQADQIDRKSFAEWACQRSFEIDQIDYLIQIAKIRKIELFFNWLDPSGDQRTSLGFNLLGQEKVAQSQVEELKTKRDQVKSTIYKNSFQVALDYNNAIKNLKKSNRPPDLKFYLRALSKQLRRAIVQGNFETQEFEAKIRAILASIVQWESNLAAFRIARAKKDRLLLDGAFERLLPQLPSLRPPVEIQ